MSDLITLVQNALRALAENDVDPDDWGGRIYCYEWEAPALLASGVSAEHIVIIPSELPDE